MSIQKSSKPTTHHKRRASLGDVYMCEPKSVTARQKQAAYYGHQRTNIYNTSQESLQALSQFPDIEVLAVQFHGNSAGNILDNYNRETDINHFLTTLMKFKIHPKEIFLNLCDGKKCLQKISQEVLERIYRHNVKFVHASDHLLATSYEVSRNGFLALETTLKPNKDFQILNSKTFNITDRDGQAVPFFVDMQKSEYLQDANGCQTDKLNTRKIRLLTRAKEKQIKVTNPAEFVCYEVVQISDNQYDLVDPQGKSIL